MKHNHWEQADFKKEAKLKNTDKPNVTYMEKEENWLSNYVYSDWKMKTASFMLNAVSMLYGIHSFNENSKILEIGCGPARLLRESRILWNCHVTGCDINQEVIDINKSYFKNRCEFEKADLRKHIPFSKYEDDTFDLGFCSGFLMHIPPSDEKTRLINEFNRTCKRLIILEYVNIENMKKVIDSGNEFTVHSEFYNEYSPDIIMSRLTFDETGKYWLFFKNKHIIME